MPWTASNYFIHLPTSRSSDSRRLPITEQPVPPSGRARPEQLRDGRINAAGTTREAAIYEIITGHSSKTGRTATAASSRPF
jgi:hypothetical protein